jgi:hypothetical protein
MGHPKPNSPLKPTDGLNGTLLHNHIMSRCYFGLAVPVSVPCCEGVDVLSGVAIGFS